MGNFYRKYQSPNTLAKINQRSITRSPYFNKKLEGNECQRFIKKENLRKLRIILLEAGLEVEVVHDIIEACNAVREVYSSCCGTTLDPNHRAVTENFKAKWKNW